MHKTLKSIITNIEEIKEENKNKIEQTELIEKNIEEESHKENEELQNGEKGIKLSQKAII